MFLRSNNRKKDGKDHRYFSIVENHRISSGKTVQRTVLYLGEINDQQQAAWRKSLAVFDEEQQEYANLSLFPDDREIPADAVDSLQVKLSGLELRRPRLFGSCLTDSEVPNCERSARDMKENCDLADGQTTAGPREDVEGVAGVDLRAGTACGREVRTTKAKTPLVSGRKLASL
jgi:hypothetical protein